jgi:hypothetical protein
VTVGDPGLGTKVGTTFVASPAKHRVPTVQRMDRRNPTDETIEAAGSGAKSCLDDAIEFPILHSDAARAEARTGRAPLFFSLIFLGLDATDRWQHALFR